MRLINPGFYIFEDEFDPKKIKRVERAARLCYKSDLNDDPESFLKDKCDRGHTSVIEHEKITVYIVCDRGVSHEIVRHRIGASYSQESTRYCNYCKDKFGNQVTYINIPDSFMPNGTNEEYPTLTAKQFWLNGLRCNEEDYQTMVGYGATPQIARSLLDNALKTEIAITYNFRSWRNFFLLRTAKGAHPQMRQLAIPLLKVFQHYFPCFFGDIKYEELPEEVQMNTWNYIAKDDEDLDKFIAEFIMGEKGNVLSKYIPESELDKYIAK